MPTVIRPGRVALDLGPAGVARPTPARDLARLRAAVASVAALIARYDDVEARLRTLEGTSAADMADRLDRAVSVRSAFRACLPEVRAYPCPCPAPMVPTGDRCLTCGGTATTSITHT